MEKLATKVKKGRRPSLEDFRDQLKQMVNMGGLEQLLDKLPGIKPEQLADGQARPEAVPRARSASSTR